MFGYLALVLGIIDVPFASAFFMAAVGFGALLSVAAVFLEKLRLRRYPRPLDMVKLTFYNILENFGYRQLNTVWRAWAIVASLRRNQSWGAMERRGSDPVKKPDTAKNRSSG